MLIFTWFTQLGTFLGRMFPFVFRNLLKHFMSFVLFFMAKIFSLSTKLIQLLYNLNAYYCTFWILLCHLKSNLLLWIHLWNWEIANHFFNSYLYHVMMGMVGCHWEKVLPLIIYLIFFLTIFHLGWHFLHKTRYCERHWILII